MVCSLSLCPTQWFICFLLVLLISCFILYTFFTSCPCVSLQFDYLHLPIISSLTCPHFPISHPIYISPLPLFIVGSSVSVRQCGIPVFFLLFLWTLFPVCFPMYLIVPVLPTYLHVSHFVINSSFLQPACLCPAFGSSLVQPP